MPLTSVPETSLKRLTTWRKSLSILFVEESVEVQFLFQLLLQSTKHRLGSACNAAAALKAVREHDVDLVILSQVSSCIH